MPARTLIVMRHARAAELPGGADAARPLRPGGRADAAAAGRWLRASGYVPGLVLCSPATRTRQTWDEVAAELGGAPQLTLEPALYGAGARQVAQLVSEVAEGTAAVAVIGHNPAVGQLAATLAAPGEVTQFPPAAIAVLALSAGWAGLAPETASLLAFWVPDTDR